MNTDIFDFTMTNGTLIEMLNKINSFTDVGQGGVLGIFIMIVVTGTLYLMMSRMGRKDAFGIAMIINGVFAVLLRILSLINDYVLWISVALMVVGIYFIHEEASNYE